MNFPTPAKKKHTYRQADTLLADIATGGGQLGMNLEVMLCRVFVQCQ